MIDNFGNGWWHTVLVSMPGHLAGFWPVWWLNSLNEWWAVAIFCPGWRFRASIEFAIQKKKETNENQEP
jgi:hypothetical protein